MKRKLKEKREATKSKKRIKPKKSHPSEGDAGPGSNDTTHSSQLEQHILNFSRLGQSDKSSGVFGSALSQSFMHGKQVKDDMKQREELQQELDESLSFLSAFLTSIETDGTSTRTCNVSKNHVASLLFPWITKSLVQKLDHAPLLVWETFTACLETLLFGNATRDTSQSGGHTVLWNIIQGSEKTGILKTSDDPHSKETVGNILTQGTMNKLVPCMIRTSFGRNNVDSEKAIVGTEEIKIMAAKSFGLIVASEFYRPTIDYVCSTVIPLVDEVISNLKDEEMDEEMKDDGPALVPGVDIMLLPYQTAIVYLTLQLLISLQSKGRVTNPKKTFQLVSSSEMLIALTKFYRIRDGNSPSSSPSVDITGMVKKLVWWALFDPQHHIDGFRSMNFDVPILDKDIQNDADEHKKWAKGRKDSKRTNIHSSGNSCYQQSLLNSIQLLMQRKEDKSNSVNTTNMSLFLPLLIEGFMTQLVAYDTKISKNTSRRADYTAKLQFRFWSNIVHPLVELVKADNGRDLDAIESRCILESIQKCLLLLLQFDGYLPSYEDRGNMHLNYLSAIGNVILAAAEGPNRGKSGPEFIRICLHLFTLNHHIFHQKLSRLITCSTKAYSEGNDSTSSEFICSLVNTYQKLRQLGHFTKSILSSANDYYKIADGEKSKREFPFLGDTSFCRSISLAIQHSPIGQVQEVWELVDQYILDTPEKDLNALIHTVEVFVMVLKAVRVGSFNAKSIQELCEKSMGSSVPKLIKFTGDQTKFDITCPTTNNGLYLWGWIVFVHTKCCFWLNKMPHEVVQEDSTGEDGICGAKMLPSLLATIEIALVSSDHGGVSLEALQHLACHRIQQLHSSIYQQQQIEQMKAVEKTCDNESQSSKMIKEAQLLVKFIFHAACHRHVGKGKRKIKSLTNRTAGWKVICESLATWVSYSSIEHHELFLRWFFLVQSVTESDETDPIHIPLLGDDVTQVTLRKEKAAAMALLYDASFLECRIIFQDMLHVGFSCASELLQCNFAQNKTFDRSIFDILDGASRKGNKMAVKNVEGAIRILRVMRLVHKSDATTGDMNLMLKGALSIHLHSLKRIESYTNSSPGGYYSYYSPESYGDIVSLMNICEGLMSDAFSILGEKRDEFTQNGESITKRLVHYVLRSGRKSLECLEKAGDESFAILEKSVSKAGSSLLRAIAVFGFNSFDMSKNHIQMFFTSMEEALKSTTNGFHFYLTMIRPSFQLCTKYIDETRTKQVKMSKSDRALVTSVERALLSLQNFLQPKCISYIHERLCREGINHARVANCMFFMADIFSSERAIRKKKKPQDDDSITETQEILSNIMRILEKPKGDVTTNTPLQLARLYLFSSMVGNNILGVFSSTERKLQIQRVISHQYQATGGQVHPLLDSAYAKILGDASPEEVSILASDLLSFEQKMDVNSALLARASAIYCFHLMSHTVKGQIERGVLSSLATHLMPVAFDLVFPMKNIQSQQSHENWTRQVSTVQGMMRTLIEKNDLILLKGCDVANMLATVSSVFYQSSPRETMNIDEKVYTASCNIVASLLKYYPKQLYSCAPSFTSAIRSLLNHIVIASSDRNKNDGIKMIQEFTKICEILPEHKDVFRKHMMHVVLFFIGGLEKYVDPQVKTQLEPAIFLLLDTLSEFEMKQMNTMMQPTVKVLFQSVFKNYQKNQYKGQF